MGELFINTDAGGVSDDITAKKRDVLKGKTAVTADSGDEIVEGTLELTGNASTGNVESGKTFYNTDAHIQQTGTLRNASKDTPVKHALQDTIPVIIGDAAFVSTNTDGTTRAEIRFNESRGIIEPKTLIGIPQAIMASAGGLSTAKLLKGQSAFGISGTATGDATSGTGDILIGKTAYVNGSKVTGTMPNQGEKSASLYAGGSYTIPAGYHNGKGKITAVSLSSQTDGNAGAGDILTGKMAWVNGSKVVGNMANQGTKNAALNCGDSYTIPGGYHSGSGKVAANSLSSQTNGTATSGQILSGKIAWVNGAKITGTIESMSGGTYTPSLNTQTILCSGKYMTSNIVIGSMSNQGKLIVNQKHLTEFTSSGSQTVDLMYDNIGINWLILYTYRGNRLTSIIPTPENSDMFLMQLNRDSSSVKNFNNLIITIPQFLPTAMIKINFQYTSDQDVLYDPIHICFYGYISN